MKNSLLIATASILMCGAATLTAQTPQASSADSSPPAAVSTSDWAPQDHPTLEVRRAPGPIEIDGSLDDAGWEGAARARISSTSKLSSRQ